MIGPLQNAMRLQAQRALAYLVTTEIGTVTSYDPNKFSAKVLLQPDELLTGWLPVASPWIGNGWGLFAPPNIGDLVSVEFINGNWGAGTVVGRFWNNANRPLPVPSGEFWLVHSTGSYFKMLTSGEVTFSDARGATVSLDGHGNITSQAKQWTHTGPVHFTDDVQVDGTLTANVDVIAAAISLLSHLHSGVSSGGSNTGPPV
ncbi:MAG TPA: phage baseplate assembly protein V [Steroidobacteraceae bacterium]|nr:phage baseplate assembly protein V [Steroidobacteraceae bacterium]